MVDCFQDIEKISHYIDKGNKPVKYRYEYQVYFYKPAISFEEGLSIQKVKKADDMFNKLFGNKLKQAIGYFTDGSKIKDKPFVGFAYVCTDKEVHQRRTPAYASIFSAEAMAIYSVLIDIKKRKENEYLIFTDSQSVLIALYSNQNLGKRSHIIFEIKKELMILKNQNKNVMLYWIPAHAGIKYNEIVDEKAKESIGKGIDSQILISNTDFKCEWKKLMKDEFDNWCLESSQLKGTDYFKYYFKKSLHPWFHKLKFKRRSIVSINRMRSGHNSTNTSLKNIKIKNDSMCECGVSNETLNHIFFQCNKYDDQRKFLIKNFIKNGKYPPFNIVSILSEMNDVDIINVAKFINSINKNI